MTVHVLELAIRGSTRDAQALKAALARLHAEDPTFGYRSGGEPATYTLLGADESQLERAVDRLKREFGSDLVLDPAEVAFRETITRAVEYDYTHKRQAGGTGQFARLKLRLDPLERGSGLTFEQAIRPPGGLPTELARVISQSVTAACQVGAAARYPIVDVKVTLVDAAYHDTDSTVPVFATAAIVCFREAMAKAGPQLLEPIMRVEVSTPDEFMGDVIGDLNSRRGWIHGMDPRAGGRIIVATAPMQYMLGYTNRLRGMTQGRATVAITFDHYAPLGGPDDFDPPGGAMAIRIA